VNDELKSERKWLWPDMLYGHVPGATEESYGRAVRTVASRLRTGTSK